MDTLLRLFEIKEWYNRSDVKFEIIKSTKNRETAFLIPSWVTLPTLAKTSTRMLKMHSVQHFDLIAKTGLGLIYKENRPYNLYYSLAHYKTGIPDQTFKLYERDNSSWTSGVYIEHIDAYDFLIDIDAGDKEDLEMAYESTKDILRAFNSKNVPYEVRFSGNGFHIIIPYRYFDVGFSPVNHLDKFTPKADNNIYILYRKIAKELNDRFSEMIDLGIYDSRRVCKIPFSLALYEKEIYVCYPFRTIEEFDNFTPEFFSLSVFSVEGNVRQNRKVFNEEGSIKPLLEMMK